jgi:hypothetical protein
VSSFVDEGSSFVERAIDRLFGELFRPRNAAKCVPTVDDDSLARSRARARERSRNSPEI